jgi:hypothetical protein
LLLFFVSSSFFSGATRLGAAARRAVAAVRLAVIPSVVAENDAFDLYMVDATVADGDAAVEVDVGTTKARATRRSLPPRLKPSRRKAMVIASPSGGQRLVRFFLSKLFI